MSELVVSDVAPGVRQLTVTSTIGVHVYLIDTAEGVVVFDAAFRGAGPEILAAAGGSVSKVILSHSHVDHRGAAAELAAPIYCHPDEVEDAQGDGGQAHYGNWDLIANPVVREGIPQLHKIWDGGPVEISGTLEEGDEVDGFRVIHVPGHALGLIALYREADRLLLGSDAVYTLDAETGEGGPARVPHPAFNWDTALARQSIKKLKELGAASVWTGHAGHLSRDIAAQLDAAAAWPYRTEPSSS